MRQKPRLIAALRVCLTCTANRTALRDADLADRTSIDDASTDRMREDRRECRLDVGVSAVSEGGFRASGSGQP